MVVSKNISDFPDNAMDIWRDIDAYGKFCKEHKLPFRYHQLYKKHTPWIIFWTWRETGKLDLKLWSPREK